jgi:nucleotidyltransferase/DNA polymerase involved in DNA repair
MYSRSAKGGEKGDPNRNPWLAKMIYTNTTQNMSFLELFNRLKKFNLETLIVNQVKVSKLWQTGKMFLLEPKREVANRCHM